MKISLNLVTLFSKAKINAILVEGEVKAAKMEVDYSETTAKAIPEAEAKAKGRNQCYDGPGFMNVFLRPQISDGVRFKRVFLYFSF